MSRQAALKALDALDGKVVSFVEERRRRRAAADDARYAVDPVAFAVERLGWTPDAWQGDLLGSSGDVLLNCSRQSGKSTTTAVLALHTAMYQPASLILLLSPTLRQSGELFRKVTDFRRRIDPAPLLVEDNRLSFELANGSRVVSLPGKGENVRGFSGPRLIIEDEGAFVDDKTHKAVRPMLAVSGGRLIVMSTPYGRRGHFFEAWNAASDSWRRVQVRAVDCPRISADFLERERAELGDLWFRQEYGCVFAEQTDQIFRARDIDRAVTSDIKPLFGTGAGNPDPIKPLFPGRLAA